MASPHKLKIILGLLSGLVVGAVATGFVAGIASYAVLKGEERHVRQGWNLVPTVVAARALGPGEKLAFDAMSQRSIPEQLVTASVVKPDSAAYVKDQAIIAPLSAGDPLHWALFLSGMQLPGPGPASPADPEVWEACDAALAASPSAPKRERTPADVRARLMSEERR